MWMVNFRADHALQTHTAMVNRYNCAADKIKIMACSYYWNGERASPGRTRQSLYTINAPGGKIWAYILLHDQQITDVREAHVNEDVQAGNFVEISHDHLVKIAPLSYEQQCLPT
jgi:hypothetical protein